MSSKYPVGFRREGCPEVLDWPMVVEIGGRSNHATLYLRDNFDDFPIPYAVVSKGPLYLADEIREFFDKYPKSRQGGALDPDLVTRIQVLHKARVPAKDIAEVLGVSVVTVYRHWNQKNKKGISS